MKKHELEFPIRDKDIESQVNKEPALYELKIVKVTVTDCNLYGENTKAIIVCDIDVSNIKEVSKIRLKFNKFYSELSGVPVNIYFDIKHNKDGSRYSEV
jgi:hypothetical protein